MHASRVKIFFKPLIFKHFVEIIEKVMDCARDPKKKNCFPISLPGIDLSFVKQQQTENTYADEKKKNKIK